MIRHRVLLPNLALVVLLLMQLSNVACAGNKPPTGLNPEATRAWYVQETIKDLDRVRDAANDAHATTPPLITADEALKVVQWHEVAITIAHNARTGWQSVLDASIQQLQTVLSAATWQLIEPYLRLAQSVMKAVQS